MKVIPETLRAYLRFYNYHCFTTSGSRLLIRYHPPCSHFFIKDMIFSYIYVLNIQFLNDGIY